MHKANVRTTPPETRLAFTVSEFVQASGIGRSSVWEMIRTGKLESKKVAGRRLILADSGRKLLQPEAGEAA